jgi:hypothetical protein
VAAITQTTVTADPQEKPMTETMRALVGGAAPDWEFRNVEVPTGPGEILVIERDSQRPRGPGGAAARGSPH